MLRNGLEPWHVIILLAVILLVFGGKKLPELARGSGRALRIFKAETKGVFTEDEANATAKPGELDPGTSATAEAAAPAAPAQAPAQAPVQAAPVQAAPVQAEPDGVRRDAGTD